MTYARHMKRCLPPTNTFCTQEVTFYLDSFSFIYKHNPLSSATSPKSRIWCKRGEGPQFTTKGSKDVAGGRRLNMLVTIARGKGVILREPYEKMDSQFFAQFIRDHFNSCFLRAGPKTNGHRFFVIGNDPSQTSNVDFGLGKYTVNVCAFFQN